MIIINVQKERGIEAALKIYKSKVQKSKQLILLKDKQNFIKPSVEKRNKIKKAIYFQRMKNGLD